MPGFTTHYLFGVDVYHLLNHSSLKQIIHKFPAVYQLGLQGPDIFFFYLPCLLGDPSKNLGSIMHQSKVNEFFQNYILEMEACTGIKRQIGIAYLAGFLCHYYLDTFTHPFIYSRTNNEIYNVAAILKEDNSVSKEIKTLYYAEHRILETNIDTLMLKRQKNIVPSKFLKDKIARIPKELSAVLSPLLCNSINKTYYNCGMLSVKTLYKVFHSMKRECKVLANNSKYKKPFIEKIENRYLKFPLLSSLIPSDDIEEEKDALNLSHNTWVLPWNTNICNSSSFLDLYEDAKKHCNIALLMLENYIELPLGTLSSYLNKNILLQKLNNNSYHTGIPLSEPTFNKTISAAQ